MTHLDEGLGALLARAGAGAGRKPPVERWNPPFCGDIDMRIAANGSWHYLGSPIGREALVRLFASVLRHDEDGCHYLVTPVEKVRIRVDDAPFLAVELHAEGQGAAQRLTLRTSVGDVVVAGPDHRLRFVVEPETGGLKPYVRVRGRLDALLARPLLYELAGLFEDRAGEVGVWSDGVFFALPPAAVAALSGGLAEAGPGVGAGESAA
ncbi:DUF1285 domain-containing protein [Microvirga tunisiensis]|uniref:DUF1285 domain-containing protein n=2 Tax=Pannonibacter tanglangensis TaxID=2750084 RepID=A0A7X5EZ95_9HYPH|nr:MULTISPECIES: DUF1285 domain-containing protein [unclassified Pannonibacter]NBN63230.1 DUF1285 domain-containing protein [Pannonibacter sp. XCT-34]NBN76868.1 DUF1285 domain-containing protein [Pannonibacter sp. XCT-53]